jgi:hypothetical protein
MYLLVLAFTFVNCYCLMILFLHFLSLFTYYVQIPFLNQINKIFKLPYFFRISHENLFCKDSDNSGKFYLSSDQEDDSTEEKTNDSVEQKTNDLTEEKTHDKNLLSKERINNLDEDTEDEEQDKKSTDIEDFIDIRKNKFLIDESLD